ncbi:PaaI family thioesterase [Peribacillus sp. SI8-4]|uniref:PaaI family thioesterase n=1 Tax=Peribacillus sp. SI8-4 TaxID=3048009 RepID=UPI002557707F|nr:PaaI family thioesterase [Peribacillus sp. SI8-4]
MTDSIDLIKEFQELAESADTKELSILAGLISGLKARRVQNKYSYISSLLELNKNVSNEGTKLTMTMPNTPLVHNELNITHGGMLATLIDTAMGTLAGSTVPIGYATVTTDIQVRYVKPSIGEVLTCTCELIHMGSKTIIIEGKVHRDDGELCAVSTGNFFILEMKETRK